MGRTSKLGVQQPAVLSIRQTEKNSAGWIAGSVDIAVLNVPPKLNLGSEVVELVFQ